MTTMLAPVRMTLGWCVPTGVSRRITAALQGLMIETRSQRGCLGCTCSTAIDGQVVISYVEDWKTEDDLKDQLRSHRFTALAELIEYASEEPTIEFRLPGGSRGIEYADDIRRETSRV